MTGHLVNQLQYPELGSDNTLHVVGVVSNPVRYHSRYRLARDWLKAMRATPNVKTYLVEATFGDRQFELTSDKDPTQLQLRTNSEIWIKENMINLGVRRLLPRDWKYMAWIDCDVSFDNPDWAQETLHELQRNPVVQPWTNALDLDAYGSVYQTFRSFGAAWDMSRGTLNAKRNGGGSYYGAEYAHSGFAWACRRDFYESVEKLIDFCIIGAGDHHMAWGMVDQIISAVNPKASEPYKKKCLDWQSKAAPFLQGRIGAVPGFLKHMHHGPKKRREYWGRWDIQIENEYNPVTDITYDSQGVIRLTGGNLQLERDIQKYNRMRMEDSIESY